MPQEQISAVSEPIVKRSTTQWGPFLGFKACLTLTNPIALATWRWVATLLFWQPTPADTEEESQKREVGPMHTTGNSDSLPGSTIKCSPPGPTGKQVWFNLADEVGDAPQLPANTAGFLEWPEGATDEQSNAEHPPAPSATGPQLLPKRGSDWQWPTTATESRLKSGTVPSTGPVATGGAWAKCLLCWTQSSANMSWSRHTLERWRNPPAGGQNSSPFTRGAHEDLVRPGCRN